MAAFKMLFVILSGQWTVDSGERREESGKVILRGFFGSRLSVRCCQLKSCDVFRLGRGRFEKWKEESGEWRVESLDGL